MKLQVEKEEDKKEKGGEKKERERWRRSCFLWCSSTGSMTGSGVPQLPRGPLHAARGQCSRAYATRHTHSTELALARSTPTQPRFLQAERGRRCARPQKPDNHGVDMLLEGAHRVPGVCGSLLLPTQPDKRSHPSSACDASAGSHCHTSQLRPRTPYRHVGPSSRVPKHTLTIFLVTQKFNSTAHY